MITNKTVFYRDYKDSKTRSYNILNGEFSSFIIKEKQLTNEELKFINKTIEDNFDQTSIIDYIALPSGELVWFDKYKLYNTSLRMFANNNLAILFYVIEHVIVDSEQNMFLDRIMYLGRECYITPIILSGYNNLTIKTDFKNNYTIRYGVSNTLNDSNKYFYDTDSLKLFYR